MKKYLKIMACAVMVLAMGCVMSSCKKEYKTQVVYTAGWGDYVLKPSDFKVVQDYLAEKGALDINQHKIYNVTSTDSEADCLKQADEMAKADFANAIRNLKVEEIQPKLSVGSYFTYGWYRTDDSGNDVEIGKWFCPAKPVPSVFGKITVNGTEFNVTSAVKTNSVIGGLPAVGMVLLSEEDTAYSLMVVVEQEDVIPEGQFDVDGEHNKGSVRFNAIRYDATGTTCRISKNGDYYKFESSGTATDKDGNKIEFIVDCDQVVFI